MVVDTSALLAILFAEPAADRMVDAILDAPIALLGAPSLVEATAVTLARRGSPGVDALDALLKHLQLDVVPMTGRAALHARDAYARFGKGVGAPAVLNFGDALAYGVARALGQPLLFQGDDFPRTDIEAVPY